MEEITEEKKNLLELLIKNKEDEAKFIFFRNKGKKVYEIYKSDINFYSYYQLVKQNISKASSEASLDSLVIGKSRSVNLTISFIDYQSMLSFFQTLESDDFLKNFQTLTLVNFIVIDKPEKTYQFQLMGKFKNNGNGKN